MTAGTNNDGLIVFPWAAGRWCQTPSEVSTLEPEDISLSVPRIRVVLDLYLTIIERDPHEEMMKPFRFFDDDDIGKINFHNLRRIAKEPGENMTDEEILEMIDEAHRDGDGEINEDEFMRIMRKTNLLQRLQLAMELLLQLLHLAQLGRACERTEGTGPRDPRHCSNVASPPNFDTSFTIQHLSVMLYALLIKELISAVSVY